MKKKKIYINVLSAFAMSTFIAGAFLIFACGKAETSGKFNKDRLLVSKGEVFGVSDYFKGSDKVEFISLDENIVDVEEDLFIGVNPGLTYIYSVTDGVKGDYIEIFVKDEFSEPKGIELSEDGLISWNNVYSYIGGEQYTAEYELNLNGNIISSRENSYLLEREGQYTISIRAAGQELIDPSPWGRQITLFYQKMGKPKNITFTPSEDISSMKGVLSWAAVDRAKYKVVVDSIEYETTETHMELDFSKSTRRSVYISVEAVDKQGKFISSKSAISLYKLDQPKVTYQDGVLSWQAVEGAEKYNVIYSGEEGHSNFVTSSLSTTLEGVDAGVYDITVQALAGLNYINSDKIAIDNKVVKLGKSDVSYALGDGYVDVNISTTSNYLKNFKILKNDEEINVSISEGNSVTTRINLTAGAYDFKVQSLPSYNGLNVFPMDGVSQVVSSDLTDTKRIYMLAEAENFIHYFDDRQNSILEFKNVENAESYEIMINEKSATAIETSVVGNKVKINLGVINRTEFNIQDGKSFNIDLIAKKNSDTINSLTRKTIKVYDIVEGKSANGTDFEEKNYSWKGREDAEYGVTIYRTTDSNYDLNGLDPIFSGKLEETNTADLPAGFYVIEIRTLTTNSDKYWSSSEVMTDNFIISENEENPYFLDFYYDSSLSSEFSGYGIKFKIPTAAETYYQNPRKYQIYVNDTKILEADASKIEQILTYDFSSDFKFDAGVTKIVLRTICSDTELSKIQKPSSLSILNVEKLEAPSKESVSTRDDNILKVALKGNAEQVVLSKEGAVFEDENGYLQEIDLSKYVGSFNIEAYYDSHKDFTTDEDFTSGNYYIESEKFTIACQRDEIPSNFSYYKKEISFDHNGEADKFNLIIKIKTKNDINGKTWKTQIGEKTLNLDNLISVLGSEFGAYYSQKVEMTIDIYSSVSKFVGGTYFISSINDTETSKGMSHIDVTQLKNVTDLTYKKATDKLEWTSSNPSDTNYEIYINNKLHDEVNVYSSEESGVYKYEYSLSGFVTTPGEEYNFNLIATKRNSFDSNISNTLTVKKLKSLDSIKVYTNKDDETTYIRWDLTSEQVNLIESIVINEAIYTVTEQTGSIVLPSEVVRIKLISKGESSTKLQYKDSDATEFTIREAEDNDYSNFMNGTVVKKESSDWLVTSDLGSSYIEWTPFEDDNVWSREQAAVNYTFVIYKQDGSVFSKVYTGNENRIALSDTTLKSLVKGQYKFNVYACFEEYLLRDKGEASTLTKYLSADNISIRKLADVQNVNYSVETTIKDSYESELTKKIKISWEHEDASSEIYYNIQLLNSNHEVVFSRATRGNLEIDIDFGEISSLEVKYVSITAYSPSNLFSNSTEIQVMQNEVPSAVLSDNGTITVNSSSASRRYIIKAEIAGKTYNYVLDGSRSISIYDCFKLENLSGNIKGQKENLTISIIAVGDSQTLPSEKKEIIQKEILGQGAYDIYAGYIFFRNEFANKVHILYKDGDQTKEEVLNNQQILYKAGDIEKYTYFAPTNSYIDADKTQYMGGFKFEIPASWKGTTKTFTYYFEKTGMGNSWTDLTLQTNTKQIDVKNFDDISDVQFSMDETTNHISGKMITAKEGGVFMEVLYDNYTLLYGYSEVNEIPIWNIEENLTIETLPTGQYNFKIWNMKKDIEGKTTFSSPYEFIYEKKDNGISNARVADTGYFEWDDSDLAPEKYLIECDDDNFVVTEKRFDLILLNKHTFTFTIKKIHDIPFGGSVKLSELGGKVVSVTDSITVSSETLSFSDPCSFKEITEDAEVVLEVPDSLDYNLFMEYNGKTYKVEKFKKDYGSVNYLKVREIDLIDLLGGDFVSDISEVKFSITEEGKVKSPSVKVNLSLKMNSDSRKITQVKAGNLFDEYLVYESDLKNAKKAILRMTNNFGTQVYDGLEEIVSGFWVEMEDERNTGFYTVLPTSYISSNKVSVIKIGEILDRLVMPEGTTYTIEVAPIHKNTSVEQIDWLSTVATYKRLSGISKLRVNADGTKVIWADNDKDPLTSYYLVKYNDTFRYISKDLSEIQYTEFIAGVKDDLEIYAISNSTGELFSVKRVLKDVERNRTISNKYINLTDGTLTLSWGEGLTQAEKNLLMDSSTEKDVTDKIFESGNLIKILEMIDYRAYTLVYPKQTVAEKVANSKYLLPIGFTFSELKNEQVEIKFVKDGSTKSAIVNATYLLESLDDKYINVLKKIKESISSEYPFYRTLTTFINLVSAKETRFTGIACDSILFDEIGGNIGKDIEAGVYKITMNQLGNPNRSTLKSDDNIVISSAEVLAAPDVILKKEDIVNSLAAQEVLTSKYSITFKPVETINNYKLLLRRPNEETVDQVYDIKNVSGEWLLYYGNNQIFKLTLLENGYIQIPINTIGDQTGIDTIISTDNQEYSAYIYACGQDNQFNSKTFKMNLLFLAQNNINVNKGRVNFGVFRYKDKAFDSIVIYKINGDSTYHVSVLQRSGTIIDYLPSDNGQYNFISFLTRGGISDQYTMYIDSPIYMMKNPFKLYNPTVNIEEGRFIIDENINNSVLYDTGEYQRRYTIYNNISGSNGGLLTEPIDENRYIYEAGESKYEGDYLIYKGSEKIATKFSIQNNGSNGGMLSENIETDSLLGKVSILKFTDSDMAQSRAIFQSKVIDIQARMLKDIDISLDEQGDFVWTESSSSNIGDLTSEGNKLVYKVIIEYCKAVVTNGVTEYPTYFTEQVYTTKTSYLSRLLQNPEDKDKYRYRLRVSAMYYGASGALSDEIITLEGEKYYKLKNAKYDHSEAMILRSNEAVSDTYERLVEVSGLKINNGTISWLYNNDDENQFLLYASKKADSTDRILLEINKDNLTISTEGQQRRYTFAPKTELAENTNYYLSIKVVRSDKLNIASQETLYESTFIKLPKVNENHISFIEDTKNRKTTLDFSAYKSLLNPISGTRNYFKLSVDLTIGETHFLNPIVLAPSGNMQITLCANKNDEDQRNNIYYMNPSSVSKVRLEVSPIAAEVKNVINGPVSIFEFSRPTWSSSDKITWNDSTKEFIWSYGKEFVGYLKEGTKLYKLNAATGEYDEVGFEYNLADIKILTYMGEWVRVYNKTNTEENIYYVKVLDVLYRDEYADISNIKFNVEITTREDISSSKFEEITRVYKDIDACEFEDGMKGGRFAPILSGKLLSLSVYAKQGEKNICSVALNYELSTVLSFDCFAGGDGTENNPYLVSTAAQFNLISQRSTQPVYMQSCDETIFTTTIKNGFSQRENTQPTTEKKYLKNFFKQTKDIEVSFTGIAIMGDFGGVYEGNGKTLRIVSSNAQNGEISLEEYSQKANVSCTRGVALFERIIVGGAVQNLSIDVDFTNSNSENTMFAGIAIISEGEINNIVCNSFKFTLSSIINADGGVFVSTLVGVNKGQLIDCVNKANIDIKNTNSSQQSAILAISGLASANYGSLEGCGNEGDIVTTINSSLDLRVGGLVGYNKGSINMCYNTGKLQGIRNKSNVGCIGGLTNYTINCRITYSFNNGKIYGDSGRCGGISFYANRMTLNHVFAYGDVNDEVVKNGSCNNIMFYSNNGSFGTATSCYSYVGSATNIIGVTNLSSSRDFTLGDYTIKVVMNNTYSFDLSLTK